MSFYVIIHSDRSLDYFPDNLPFQFKCHFNKPLTLEGSWELALCDIDINEKVQKPSLYVNCDLCQSMIVDGKSKTVLRKVNADMRRQFTNSFNWLFYVPVIKSEIREIQIDIKDANDRLAIFFNKTCVCDITFYRNKTLKRKNHEYLESMYRITKNGKIITMEYCLRESVG